MNKIRRKLTKKIKDSFTLQGYKTRFEDGWLILYPKDSLLLNGLEDMKDYFSFRIMPDFGDTVLLCDFNCNVIDDFDDAHKIYIKIVELIKSKVQHLQGMANRLYSNCSAITKIDLDRAVFMY